MSAVSESTVEDAALEWLRGLGWNVAHGPDIAPHATDAERDGLRLKSCSNTGCATPCAT